MAYSQMSGLYTTTDNNTSRQVLDFDKQLAVLDPNISTLYSMATILKKKRAAENTTFYWDEDKYLPYFTQINYAAGYSAAATSVVVDDGTIFKARDVIKNARTQECYLITAVSTNTLTIVRAFGTTSAAAIVDNDYIVRVGNANEEGSDRVTAILVTGQTNSNYIQIFKHSVDITNTRAAVKNRSGKPNEREYQRGKVGIDHALDIDRALLLGEKKSYSSGTEICLTTAGIVSMISTNVTTDGNGILTKQEFQDWLMYKALAHEGKGRKVVFIGDYISAALADWHGQTLKTDPKWEKIGLQVTSYLLPNGKEVLLKWHKILSDVPDYRGYAIAVDMDSITVRTLIPTKLTLNQPTTCSKYLDQYETQLGLEMTNEENFALLKGVTGWA